MSENQVGHPTDHNPTLVWYNEHGLARATVRSRVLCRFCGAAHEGTMTYGLQHWRDCSGIVAYTNARAEGVDEAAALRIGARCYLHREGAQDRHRAHPIGPMIDALLAVPSPHVMSSTRDRFRPLVSMHDRLRAAVDVINQFRSYTGWPVQSPHAAGLRAAWTRYEATITGPKDEP